MSSRTAELRALRRKGPKLEELGECSELPRYRLALEREPDVSPAQSMICEAHPCSHPAAVASFLAVKVASEPAELLGAVYLDARNVAIGWAVIYRGALSRSVCEPRGPLALGLLLNASALVLFHNHPSGDPEPSSEDLAFTRRCAEAGEILGVRVVDHLVIGGPGRYVSLRERGGW